jgi:hypothetical protein
MEYHGSWTDFQVSINRGKTGAKLNVTWPHIFLGMGLNCVGIQSQTKVNTILNKVLSGTQPRQMYKRGRDLYIWCGWLPQKNLLNPVALKASDRILFCFSGFLWRHFSMKFRVSWDVAPYNLTGMDRRFRGAYCLHHQGALPPSSSWWWRQ